MNIKAVIFDLDGVITSSSREHYLAWAKLAEQLGGKLSSRVFDAVKGRSRLESLDIVLNDLGLSFNNDEKKRLAQIKNDLYVEMISGFTEENLAPGAIALFERLQQNDIKIALASVSRNAPMLLQNMNITWYFDYIADSATIKNVKPAPDIFLKAADHFGFEPRFCVGVEDARAGIAAIKSAGMFAVGIGESTVLKQADIVYSMLKDVDIFRIDTLLAA